FLSVRLLRSRPLRVPLFPYTTLFRSRMGHRCHVRGFTVAAELFYSRAISLNGEHMPAYRGRGKLRLDAMRLEDAVADLTQALRIDRKSTRLNSSHVKISYAVFCLKKK